MGERGGFVFYTSDQLIDFPRDNEVEFEGDTVSRKRCDDPGIGHVSSTGAKTDERDMAAGHLTR